MNRCKRTSRSAPQKVSRLILIALLLTTSILLIDSNSVYAHKPATVTVSNPVRDTTSGKKVVFEVRVSQYSQTSELRPETSEMEATKPESGTPISSTAVQFEPRFYSPEELASGDDKVFKMIVDLAGVGAGSYAGKFDIANGEEGSTSFEVGLNVRTNPMYAFGVISLGVLIAALVHYRVGSRPKRVVAGDWKSLLEDVDRLDWTEVSGGAFYSQTMELMSQARVSMDQEQYVTARELITKARKIVILWGSQPEGWKNALEVQGRMVSKFKEFDHSFLRDLTSAVGTLDNGIVDKVMKDGNDQPSAETLLKDLRTLDVLGDKFLRASQMIDNFDQGDVARASFLLRRDQLNPRSQECEQQLNTLLEDLSSHSSVPRNLWQANVAPTIIFPAIQPAHFRSQGKFVERFVDILSIVVVWALLIGVGMLTVYWGNSTIGAVPQDWAALVLWGLGVDASRDSFSRLARQLNIPLAQQG